MRGHPKTRHINTDDPNTTNGLGQQLQGHARSRGYAQIRHNNRIVERRISEVFNRLPDIFKKFTGHKRFGIEGHVADASPGAIKMRREGQSVNAARRAGKNGRGSAHAQANPQGTKGRTHALRLIMRAARIIFA